MVNVNKVLLQAMIVIWLFCIGGCSLRGCDSEEPDSSAELRESDSRSQEGESREAPSRAELKEPTTPAQRDRYHRAAAELAKLKDRMPPPGPCRPVIDQSPDGIRPMSGKCGTVVRLRGECFGEEQAAGHTVQLRSGDEWIDMAIRSWADTLIEFDAPCETLGPGNYRVRVVTPNGTSNIKVFTVIREEGGGVSRSVTVHGIPSRKI